MCGILKSKEESVARIREQTALSNVADRPSKMNRINGTWHLITWKLLENTSCSSRNATDKSLTAMGLGEYMGGKNLAYQV